MKVYKSRYGALSGSSHREVIALARKEYHTIQKFTPRRVAYVRSKYFKGSKVFMNTFWDHVNQKRRSDQTRRLKLYKSAVDVIRNSQQPPETINSRQDKGFALHRFYGVSADGIKFVVQIKENKRSNRKDFMSVFPKNVRK